MLKNTASQSIGAQMVSASDGSAFTGSVTVYVTGDAGTQGVGSVGSGACTHEGNGYHTYAPAQAETNYDLVAFTFIGTGAVPATIQVYTKAGDAYTAVQALNDLSSADVNAACDTALADYGANTTTPPTAAAIADAVLDEALSGHVTAGSLGKAVADIETDATAILADTNELQTNQGNWTTATGFATASALATVDSNVDSVLLDTGTTLPATLSTIAGYIDTEVSAIKAVTDNLPNSGALTSLAQASALTTVDTVVDGIKAKTDSLTFTVAGQVDANVQYVNDVAVTGTGASGDEWGP